MHLYDEDGQDRNSFYEVRWEEYKRAYAKSFIEETSARQDTTPIQSIFQHEDVYQDGRLTFGNCWPPSMLAFRPPYMLAFPKPA